MLRALEDSGCPNLTLPLAGASTPSATSMAASTCSSA